MNTSEVLDLSKENIQPLKQGRNPVKLGTALQAQTNSELQQKLQAEQQQFELLIRMYEGDDPLQPHYDYVRWIEQSFPKHGPESNIVHILENTLTAFREDERYKQDPRYAELLIKYIDTQPNPLEIYQLVYNQGLCTMCAPFYKAWADEYDKTNDLKNADRIYELGIRVKAQPQDMLKEAHMRFQLSVGRRMLGHQEEPSEVEQDSNRQALHKLPKHVVYNVRDSTRAPGQLKQQAHALGNASNQNNAPFKFYQDDDHEGKCDDKGKTFPKHSLLNKENTVNAGPWSQHGGKHRQKTHLPPTQITPNFQVHEDDGADLKSNNPRTPSMPRALKTRKNQDDQFNCPLAIFEPPDPTKKPMYCKQKVYAGATEFQFEELRAAIYNKHHYEQLAADEEARARAAAAVAVPPSPPPPTPNNMDTSHQEAGKMSADAHEFVKHVDKTPDKHFLQVPKIDREVEAKLLPHSEPSSEDEKHSHLEEHSAERLLFEGKGGPLEANNSLFHCQSFTVNTKEAMNVVQEMWNSPAPVASFGRNSRASRGCPASPGGLDESGIFKVPALPVPHKADEASSKPSVNVPSFPIYSDDEVSPSSLPSQNFQVYSDNAEPTKSQPATEIDQKAPEKIVHPQPFFPLGQAPSRNQAAAADAATLKMLAFDSDSDDELPDKRNTVETNKPIPGLPPLLPTVQITEPSPPEHQQNRKSVVLGPLPHVFHDEDRYEDMTCNTKAFDFVLPSSTPLVGHLKTSSQPAKNCINGSYIGEEAKKCTTTTKQDLSMIFEDSKERYSSSSGSSGSKTQGSVCTVANTSVPPAHPDLVDKLAQISANKSTLEELEKSIGLLNITGPIDPFDTELIAKLLSLNGYPKKHHLIGLHQLDMDAPVVHTNSTVKLGSTKYIVIGELGKGNYARVLKATKDGHAVALKQQKPSWQWEWYIVQELQSRLPPNMIGGFLHFDIGYIYRNASILESEWAKFGSILSVVNKLKIAGKGSDLHLALLFSTQLISIVENLHKCKIIHGDIKPDNFVLCSLPTAGNMEYCLKLIDFGRSIDMSLFPEGTTFNTVVTTDGFQCNEMKEGRPWTYQTDLYGLAGSIHCVLFYDYMKVIKKGNEWVLCNKVPRYLMPAAWQRVFSTLLNVESCECQPDLGALRESLEQHLRAMEPSIINQSIHKLSNVLLNK